MVTLCKMCGVSAMTYQSGNESSACGKSEQLSRQKFKTYRSNSYKLERWLKRPRPFKESERVREDFPTRWKQVFLSDGKKKLVAKR